MINESSAKIFCKDDISKIENYDKAINDQTETWICHHRLGLTHSRKDLDRLGLYENRPAEELIFVTQSEHCRLHNMNRSDETRRKISESQKGKPKSDETKMKMSEAARLRYKDPEQRKKLSEAHKGKHSKPHKPFSDETKRKMAEAKKGEKNPQYGKTKSDETRQKMAEARKAYWARRKAQN